ncbi:MAG: hypothetical protein V2G33_07250 [bacterium JZ-2024 1]
MTRILNFVLWGFPVFLMGFVCENFPFLSPKIPFPESFRTQFPGGFPELRAKIFLYETTLEGTIGVGYYTYMTFEAKKPESVEELCQSPYMPVDCKDILNPFTGKPLLETPPDTYGWFTISTSNTSDPTSPGYFHYLLPDTKDPNLKPKEEISDFYLKLVIPSDLLGQQFYILYLPKHLEDGWKTAAAVKRSLGYALSMYRICKGFGKVPTSFEELKEMFPFLSKLRNGFRKNYAQLAGFLILPGNEIVFDISRIYPSVGQDFLLEDSPRNQSTFTEEMLTGQPGDFYILIAQPGTIQWPPGWRIIVLGDDGRDIRFKLREELEKWMDELPLPLERAGPLNIVLFGYTG